MFSFIERTRFTPEIVLKKNVDIAPCHLKSKQAVSMYEILHHSCGNKSNALAMDIFRRAPCSSLFLVGSSVKRLGDILTLRQNFNTIDKKSGFV